MKRSTFILGFALLMVAATLAMTITFRNDPRRASETRTTARKAATSPPSRALQADRAAPLPGSGPSRSRTPSTDAGDRYRVSIPAEALAGRFPAEQADLRRRAEAVQREARRRLERMTEEFELSPRQRARIFPILARSTPGYDPAMQVAGVQLPADAPTPASEEIHDLLDPDQQARLEDQQVDRQLWWQDVFSRIEAELLDSTEQIPTLAPDESSWIEAEEPADPVENRTAPVSRGGAAR